MAREKPKRQRSRDGKTESFTLRLDVVTGELCVRIAAKANLLSLKRGGTGGMTAQDVMRHQIGKLNRRFPKLVAELEAGAATPDE